MCNDTPLRIQSFTDVNSRVYDWISLIFTQVTQFLTLLGVVEDTKFFGGESRYLFIIDGQSLYESVFPLEPWKL